MSSLNQCVRLPYIENRYPRTFRALLNKLNGSSNVVSLILNFVPDDKVATKTKTITSLLASPRMVNIFQFQYDRVNGGGYWLLAKHITIDSLVSFLRNSIQTFSDPFVIDQYTLIISLLEDANKDIRLVELTRDFCRLDHKFINLDPLVVYEDEEEEW